MTRVLVLLSLGGTVVCAPAAAGQTAAGPGASRPPVHPDAAVAAATAEYQRTGTARTLRDGAYLVYPFGRSQPRLTCAPLRACTIQLEEGEGPPAGGAEIKPYTGDSERWFIGTTPGPRRSILVVVQPSDCDLSTNLTIPTDRRLYQLTLDSPPCTARDTARQNPDLPYDRTVRFYYPEDLLRQLAGDERARAAAEETEAARTTPVEAAAFDPSSLDFGYHTCRDPGYPWRPQQVFSDGVRTYVKVPAAAAAGETPVLFAVDAAGELTLLAYDVRGTVYVADRVLDRAVLLVGTGRDGEEQRLLITRHREDCPR